MNGISTRAAFERLERAIGRVERAVTSSARSREAALTKFDARHAKLRAKVQDTIAELDRVIADAAAQREPFPDKTPA
jgi:hypothetical protein